MQSRNVLQLILILCSAEIRKTFRLIFKNKEITQKERERWAKIPKWREPAKGKGPLHIRERRGTRMRVLFISKE